MDLLNALYQLLPPERWLVLAGSAGVIIFMVVVAAALGFRQSETLDQARMHALAATEGARIEELLIAPTGKAGVARLAGGKIMVARVMADGVSVRVAPTDAAQVRLAGAGISVGFADIGYPPLRIATARSGAPSWIVGLAQDLAR